MTKRSWKIYFEDILRAMDKIDRYSMDMDKEDFIKNDIVIDAVLRNLEIIGEASRNITEYIREKHPEIPWKRMIGLRNIAIHKYFSVDLDIVWKIVSENLPETRPLIEAALKKF